MALNQRIGFGTTLGVDPANGTTFDVVGSIISDGFSGNSTTDDVDISLLSDRYERSRAGMRKPGEVEMTIAYDPHDTDSTVLTTLYHSGNEANVQITYPAEGTSAETAETFHAWVKGVSRAVKRADHLVCKVTFKISGDPGYTHS